MTENSSRRDWYAKRPALAGLDRCLSVRNNNVDIAASDMPDTNTDTFSINTRNKIMKVSIP